MRFKKMRFVILFLFCFSVSFGLEQLISDSLETENVEITNAEKLDTVTDSAAFFKNGNLTIVPFDTLSKWVLKTAGLVPGYMVKADMDTLLAPSTYIRESVDTVHVESDYLRGFTALFNTGLRGGGNWWSFHGYEFNDGCEIRTTVRPNATTCDNQHVILEVTCFSNDTTSPPYMLMVECYTSSSGYAFTYYDAWVNDDWIDGDTVKIFYVATYGYQNERVAFWFKPSANYGRIYARLISHCPDNRIIYAANDEWDASGKNFIKTLTVKKKWNIDSDSLDVIRDSIDVVKDSIAVKLTGYIIDDTDDSLFVVSGGKTWGIDIEDK